MQGFSLVFGAALLGLFYSFRLHGTPWGAARFQILAYACGMFLGISIIQDVANHFTADNGNPLLRYFAWLGFVLASIGGKVSNTAFRRTSPFGN